MSDNTQEPTMEEILASIRRIISEDDPPGGAEAGGEASATAAQPNIALPEEDDNAPLVLEDEVLELTDRIDDPVELAGAPQIDDLEVMAPPSRGFDYEPAFSEPSALSFDEPLVGRSASGAAASAFDALERSIMMPPGGRTLEDVVREMLRPMLKAWLDENLPGIVEAQVAAEVERIARQRR
jgi:cell pole-organizing protein PopZ